jgi:hypothetical protein
MTTTAAAWTLTFAALPVRGQQQHLKRRPIPGLL